AAKFINFFARSKESNEILKGLRGTPIFSDVKKDLYPKLPEEGKKAFDYVDLAEKYSSELYPPMPTTYDEIDDLYQRLYTKYGLGEITAEEFAEEFRNKAAEILQNQ